MYKHVNKGKRRRKRHPQQKNKSITKEWNLCTENKERPTEDWFRDREVSLKDSLKLSKNAEQPTLLGKASQTEFSHWGPTSDEYQFAPAQSLTRVFPRPWHLPAFSRKHILPSSELLLHMKFTHHLLDGLVNRSSCLDEIPSALGSGSCLISMATIY